MKFKMNAVLPWKREILNSVICMITSFDRTPYKLLASNAQCSIVFVGIISFSLFQMLPEKILKNLEQSKMAAQDYTQDIK